MPKKNYIIKDWTGGMVNAKSPQALEDSESEYMSGFYCERKGELGMGPGISEADSSISDQAVGHTLTPGEGVFVGGSDFGLDFEGSVNTTFLGNSFMDVCPGALIPVDKMRFYTAGSSWVVDKDGKTADITFDSGQDGSIIYATSNGANWRDVQVTHPLPNVLVKPNSWFQVYMLFINTTKTQVAKAWPGDLQVWIGKGDPGAGLEMRPYRYATEYSASTGGHKGGIYVTHGGTTHTNQWSFVTSGKQGTFVHANFICQAPNFTDSGDAFIRIFGNINGAETSSIDTWHLVSCQVKKLPTDDKPKYGSIMLQGSNNVNLYQNFEGGDGDFYQIDDTRFRYSDYGKGDCVTDLTTSNVPTNRISRPSFYQADSLIRMSDAEFDWAGSPKIYGVSRRSQYDTVKIGNQDMVAAGTPASGDWQEELASARWFPEFRDIVVEDHNPNSVYRRKSIYSEAEGGPAYNDNPPLIVHNRGSSVGSESTSDYDVLKTCTFGQQVGLHVSCGHSNDDAISDDWKKRWHFGVSYKLFDNSVTNVFEGGLMDNDTTNRPIRGLSITDNIYLTTSCSNDLNTNVTIKDEAGGNLVTDAQVYLKNDIIHSIYMPTTATPSGTSFTSRDHSQTFSIDSSVEFSASMSGVTVDPSGVMFRAPESDTNTVDMRSWSRQPRISMLFKFDRMHPNISINSATNNAKPNPYSDHWWHKGTIGNIGKNYWDPRVVGYTIWAYAEEDVSPTTDTPWRLISEVDLQTMTYAMYTGDSVRKSLIQPYENSNRGAADYDDGQTWTTISDQDRAISSSDNQQVNPPISQTYHQIHGYRSDEELDIRWKHAVVCNNRTVIGNIFRNKVRYPDRIAISYPGTYDSFPESYQEDIYLNDGEDITGLAAFADKLLVFKGKKLYISNFSDPDRHFLEAEYDFYGVPHHSCITQNPYGISWATVENGVLHFDGQGITPLMKGKVHPDRLNLKTGDDSFTPLGDGKIKDSFQPSLGYDSKNDGLILKMDNYNNISNDESSGGNPGSNSWYYSFKNEDWIFGKKYFEALSSPSNETEVGTNFITLNDGHCTFFRTGLTGSTYPHATASNAVNAGFHWIDAISENRHSAANAGDIKLKTKDVDFGDPGRDKRVYKVVIRYSKSVSNGISVTYNVNGGTTAHAFSTAYLSGTGVGEVAELIPNDSSIVKNIKSMRLIIANNVTGATLDGFVIHDIAIVYRDKVVG